MDSFEVLRYCPKCGQSDWHVETPAFRKCNSCGYEMYKNPTVGAVAVIVDDQGRLLMLRRAKKPGKGTLGLPGGFCEIKETIEEAVAREVREETNLEVSVEKYLFSRPNDYEYKGIDLHPLDLFFECKIKDIDCLKLDLTENTEAVFLHPQEINLDDIGLPSLRYAVKRYFNLEA